MDILWLGLRRWSAPSLRNLRVLEKLPGKLSGYPDLPQGHPTLEIPDDSFPAITGVFIFCWLFPVPGFTIGGMGTSAEDKTFFKAPPEEFSLKEVQVRLARPDERIKWDQRVHQYHYLGFKRFAGRGLRYVVQWQKKNGWHSPAGSPGAFKCRHRDRWIGWKPEQQFRRLHLIANNTRFVILAAKGVFPSLGSFALARMLRRLSDDWQAHYGHPLLVTESFVDPDRFDGALYRAANWRYLGDTRGFARHNGRYTDPHGKPKRLYVTRLRRGALPAAA